MLAPSGGGLILYQAYGNLYAMTGRKAHLLEDKQIPNVGVFDEGVVKLRVEVLRRQHHPLTSPHALFDSLEDLPPKTTNPPHPSFESIERLANQPPPLLTVKPPLPLFPPQLPSLPPPPPTLTPPLSNFPPLQPLGPNNPFPILTHEMFCEHCQRTQVIIDDLRNEMRFILNHILDRLNVLAHNY
ncbi:hypothetical protein Tco_0436387 [Tanacetum coccineum]